MNYQLEAESVTDLSNEYLRTDLERCSKVSEYLMPEFSLIFGNLRLSKNPDVNARVMDFCSRQSTKSSRRTD